MQLGNDIKLSENGCTKEEITKEMAAMGLCGKGGERRCGVEHRCGGRRGCDITSDEIVMILLNVV